ncbi:hypothetical protein BCR33DRAFT_819069 [Rhizoclosmatium globosum]|uniref:Uncharacterized protein n=1 Tax=Rhizoclosmatium globosum TaxID=329046 RepID=A0A1Y2C9G1_9FUNG|nr:hypothetical protein BCR33DRAFT_819069 [Rhizoclosmatium globosum]|eukprot:ORY43673.1 hypothetical protein BCR33DRAFT_819069 [Rhizoclosmatium globosum]
MPAAVPHLTGPQIPISDAQTALNKLHSFISRKNLSRPLLCPHPINLGNGLLLRRAEPGDKEELAAFNARIHFPSGGRGTFDLFSPSDFEGAEHPTTDHSCFTVVVDASKDNKIVSSVWSVPQIWYYGNPDTLATKMNALDTGVPIVVVRPEGVGTEEEYRGHGLIKKHMDVHHDWARALGSPLQFIGGMPQYYCRFGYECAPERNAGVGGTLASLEPLIKKRDPKFRVRKATLDDVDFIMTTMRVNSCRRDGIWTDVDLVGWKSIMKGRQEGSFTAYLHYIVEYLDDSPEICEDAVRVGFCEFKSYSGNIHRLELADTDVASWEDLTSAVLSFVPQFHLEIMSRVKKQIQAAYKAPARLEGTGEPTTPAFSDEEKVKESENYLSSNWQFFLTLGSWHPAYQSVASARLPLKREAYYWFTRIESVQSFLESVVPVLNDRLRRSLTFSRVTFTFSITKSDYNAGGAPLIKIVQGKIASIDTLPLGTKVDSVIENGGQFVAFQGNTATRMLLGYRTASELKVNGDAYGYPKCITVLDVLFPKMANDYIVGYD